MILFVGGALPPFFGQACLVAISLHCALLLGIAGASKIVVHSHYLNLRRTIGTYEISLAVWISSALYVPASLAVAAATFVSFAAYHLRPAARTDALTGCGCIALLPGNRPSSMAASNVVHASLAACGVWLSATGVSIRPVISAGLLIGIVGVFVLTMVRLKSPVVEVERNPQ